MPLRNDDTRNARPPAKAENDAWFAYKAIAKKQDREVDERTFRDAWRQGCAFTFSATSMLSPAIAAFIDWMEYVTSWTQRPNPNEGSEDLNMSPPAGSYMTTDEMDGADAFYPPPGDEHVAKTPTRARS